MMLDRVCGILLYENTSNHPPPTIIEIISQYLVYDSTIRILQHHIEHFREGHQANWHSRTDFHFLDKIGILCIATARLYVLGYLECAKGSALNKMA
jgi:hypothetical protein